MFGFGNSNKRRLRNDTFGPGRLRNAAIAGVGMLAWRWWRNRQASNRPATTSEKSFSETPTTDSY